MISSFKDEYIDEIINLGEELNPNYKKLFHIDRLNKNEKIFTYIVDNKVVGFIHIFDGLDTLDILNIIVKEEYRQNKIGTKMIEYIIENFHNPILLEVRATNISAINFYKKLSFKEINIRKNYYNGVDAIIMERK